MARYYDQPIQVTCDGDGVPVRFIWRETTHQVRAVLARWHLRDRWWASGAETVTIPEGEAGGSPARLQAATDRYYWRLHCASPSTPMIFCVIYHDVAAGAADAAEPGPWRLERVYD